MKASRRAGIVLAAVVTVLISQSLAVVAAEPIGPYEPAWESIEQRPLPSWFNEAKFGIFVVWGPYSVPAWKDRGYAEWYGNNMNREGSPTWKFHHRVYGEDFRYEDFVPMFKAEMWDPDFWCDLFAKAGAKYVVTTANYHDGFAMWPSKYAQFNDTDRWNSVERGPKRDLIGDLNAAGERRSLKMGIYYSLYEWYHPLWKNPETRDRYVTEHLHPKFKEVVAKYKPWFIFLDGEWAADYKFWRSEELAAWLYNESPCREYVVANDRWGQCRGIHGDVYESEYGGGLMCSPEHPWQEDRGMGQSYGYNRAESIFDYDSAAEMIRMLSRCTAGGGNYLLCVGPTGDGRIPVIMQQRLLEIGDWLKDHGEAVYGAKASPFWPRRFEWGGISAKPGKLYLHVFAPKTTRIHLTGLRNKVNHACILQHKDTPGLKLTPTDAGLQIEWPLYLSNEAATVIALEIDGEPDVDKTQHQFADGRVDLLCRALKIHGTKARHYYRGHGPRLRIMDWTDPKEYLSGQFDVSRPGTFQLQMTYAAPPGPGSFQSRTMANRFVVEVNDQRIEHQSVDTGGEERFKTVTIGEVRIESTGRHTFTIRPIAEGWRGLGLQSLSFVPSS
ncbi:MAG: alpha-L-fucosidase [Planctomycetes bacterium]|nr:alpha-L-fucosidase [Planctomycetota bacterium]MBL7040871.1 alpha-L-fucosidase [Pirellulaceae bacterium]